ncbi:zinc-binding dehydrogenase [Streptosporangium becharense]|nr:zinc-binding dehydrogenase [Streptosporangium becharense]
MRRPRGRCASTPFPVRRTCPLHRVADAHREVETRHGRGKVVLTTG